MKKRKKNLERFLVVIITAQVFFLIGFFCYEGYRSYFIKNEIEKAQSIYHGSQEDTTTATPTPLPPSVPPASTPEPLPEPTPKAVRPEFLSLIDQFGNTDIVGYLLIEGTSIDYPVVQAADNNFYLNNDINKNKSSAGWIYLDFENDIAKEDKNTIIYGHNMRSDTMFHDLRDYRDENFFKEHRYVKFDTLYDDTIWEVFSFYKTTTDFYYIQVVFPTADEFDGLIRQMKAKSMYDTGVEVSPADRILTLSTCSNESDDTRYVLNAKLVSKD